MLLLLFAGYSEPPEPVTDVTILFQRKDYTVLGPFKKTYNKVFKSYNVANPKKFTIK